MYMNKNKLHSLLLFLLTCLVFSGACLNGFIEAYDDELYVTLNPMVRHGLTAESVKWAFTAFVAGNWHPLTLLSHMTDVQLFGLNPFGHHLVSVVLHALSSVLLLRFLRLLTFDSRISWLLAAMFAVHPLRVESVAWVAERKDVLSVLFGLATLLAYEWYVRNAAVCRYLIVLSLFALAVMSKPMLVTLPFLLLLMDFFHFDRCTAGQRVFVLAEKIPFLLLSGLTAGVTLLAQQEGNALVAATVVERLAAAVSAYPEYLRLFILPLGLSFHYPLKPGMFGVGRVLFSLLVLVVISALVHCRRGTAGMRLGWWWFLLTLLPVTGIVRFGGQFVADRYTYLPQIGLLIMIAAAISVRTSWLQQKKLLWAGGALVIILSSVTIRQIGYWQSGEVLYRRAIALDRENWLAHTNLGSVLMKKDRYGEGFLELARGQLYKGNPEAALETLRFAYRERGASQPELDALQQEIRARLR